MKTTRIPLFALILLFFSVSCTKNEVTGFATNPADGTIGKGPVPHYPHPRVVPRMGPPNIIFLLADDMGYEMPTFDGGSSYTTPNLDSLALNGMRFTQCRAQPTCSPSRVELLSGLYNFRNYLKYGWSVYDTQFASCAKVLQSNGYTTCAIGKWQLGDLDIGFNAVGFDDYCVLNQGGTMYNNSTIYIPPGQTRVSNVHNVYSEDIVGDYALKFIHNHSNVPFFIYYATNLIHSPDQPTPLDPNWYSFDDKASDPAYIGSMTHYLDVRVGLLLKELKADHLDNNTIIVFTGDNGSTGDYQSVFNGQVVTGEKGRTTEMGTHVPLFVYWPGHISPGKDDNLVDFTDFAPTFFDMAELKNKPPLDGVSFYPQLFGQNATARTWTYSFYDPIPVPLLNYPISQPTSYAQDTAYKLYKLGNRAGKFYHFTQDPEENHAIKDDKLTPEQAAIKQKLSAAMQNLQ